MVSQEAQHERGESHDGIIRRSFGVTTRAVDLEARTVTVIASTTTVDSHGDIVEQDWDLTRYRKNPVVLWNHNVFGAYRYSDGMSCPEDLLPIGHSTSCSVEGGQLVATIKFGSAEYNEMSQRVFLGFAEGHIRAVSVGFYPGVITEEQVEGGYRYRLSACELLEISAVPIPSNPDAVAKSAAFAHEQVGRLVAERRARAAQEKPSMDTAEMKAALDSANGEVAKLKVSNEAAVQRADKAEALNKQLADDLKAANEKLAQAATARSKTLLDGLQGKKFAPAEREKLDALVAKAGIDDVVELLQLRADLPVVAATLAGGLETRGIEQPAPTSAEGNAADAIISDLVKSARAAN